MGTRQLNHLDICSGIGSFSLAAEHAGFTTVAHCEIHPFACAVLRKHWPDVPIIGDLKAFSENPVDTLRALGISTQIDLFSGGPPCQPTSIAGQRKGSNDERWLWNGVLRLVSQLRPLWLCLENPTGALSLTMPGDEGDESLFIDWVCDALEAEGYEVQPYVIGAWSVGAPQRRDRVFIVGKRLGEPKRFGCPRQSWRNADASYEPVADSDSREPSARSQQSGADGSELCRSSNGSVTELADASHGRLRRRRSQRRDGQPAACGEGMADTSDGVGLVDPNDTGREEQWIEQPTDPGQSELGSWRKPQPRLGGETTGTIWRLDRPLWPAGRGVAQFAHEPSRLASSAAFRQERLMTLGNMVVPQCVLPFFEFIFNEITKYG